MNNEDKHIKAEIIADSISPTGQRLTSWILEYPRFVHSELLTHRVFSKNAASSRAIPVEKLIQQVIDSPAMPVWWGKNQSGMQAAEELNNVKRSEGDFLWRKLPEYQEHYAGSTSGVGNLRLYKLTDLERAKITWLEARDSAIAFVKRLNKIGLHKQIANRILEPWFNIRVILSGTDFDNFFELRAHKDAQPEFQNLAFKMKDLYETSKPKLLKAGEWHVPFGDKIDYGKVEGAYLNINNLLHVEPNQQFSNELENLKRKISVARCARVSYFNFDGKDDYEADIKLCDRLFAANPKHLSPTEHVAQCAPDDARYANFKGWRQYRGFLEGRWS